MKLIMLNKSRTYILMMVLCMVLTSCKRLVLIQGKDLAGTQVCDGSLWTYIECSLLNQSFFLWLGIDLLLALFLWWNGYKILKWFKYRPMSTKVTIIIALLAMLFVVGCISQDVNMQHYGGWFALPVTMAIGSTIVVGWALIQRYHNRISHRSAKPMLPESFRRQRNLILLAKAMIWIWSCGWVVYFVAIGIGKQPHVGAEVLLRSAVASLDLFLMDIDSNVLDAVQDHDVLKGLIACISFAAVICTATLILSLVMARLMAYLHIKHVDINNGHNHLYIFFGMNEASKLLAKDIYLKDEHSVIVFVENSLAGETEQGEDKTDGWKNIVSMLTHRRKTFADAEENDRRALAIANCDLCSLDKDTDDVLGNIGLETVKALLRKLEGTNDGELHVFFLSGDGDANVRSTSMIVKDALIGSKGYNTIIHCHARRNGVNKIIEDMGIASENRIEVKIVDSSHLAMEYLKSNECNHPVNFVDVNTLNDANPGAVSSKFVSLIVGFGETGQEALSFLYEFGAFVDVNASERSSYRSPFRCYVVDKDAKSIEGNFIASLPGVSINMCESARKDTLVNMYDYDFRSTDFYDKVLCKIAEELNYVVVALGDDEQNMSVAVDILRYVRIKRKNLDKFHIYVRAHEKGTFKHLREIAKHYNERLGETKITLFGQNEEIYTYDLIVRDRYQEEGKVYYETYRSLGIDPCNDEGTWDERHAKLLSSTKNSKWYNMTKLRRKESQDRSNALHSLTKLMLLEKVIGKENVNSFIQKVLGHRVGRQSSIIYTSLNEAENMLMLNLAMCEHLRWNAAHEMLGYVNNNSTHECDDLRKMHNCLKPWELLDQESDAVSYIDDYKVYDFGVVETTFLLNINNNMTI